MRAPSHMVAVLAVALCAAGARAQDTAGDEAYQRTIAEAVSEYAAGRYPEARALFRRAHDLEPNARTLRGIGMAAFEMREYAEALRALESSLTESRRPLTDEQRAHVQGLIDRSEAYVGRYAVTLAPAEARLLVDGAPVQLDRGALILDLGDHQLEARCEGCEPARRAVHVRGGERQDLRLAAAPRASSEPPAPIARTMPPEHDRAESGGGAGVVFLVAAGVLAAGGAASAVWWLDRNDELDRCRAAGPACRNEDALSSERSIAAVTTIGIAAAAIGMAVAGVLSLRGGGDERDAQVACAPTIGGMGCAGRF